MGTKAQIVPDPVKNGKKCGGEGSSNRLFKLRNQASSVEACGQECAKKAACIAYSGVMGVWCIGCKVPLDTHDGWHGKAVAYKKASLVEVGTSATDETKMLIRRAAAQSPAANTRATAQMHAAVSADGKIVDTRGDNNDQPHDLNKDSLERDEDNYDDDEGASP